MGLSAHGRRDLSHRRQSGRLSDITVITWDFVT